MDLFEPYIDAVRAFAARRPERRSTTLPEQVVWPRGGRRNIVLGSDMAFELGSPQMESFSVLLWSEQADRVRDRSLTLIGPDISRGVPGQLPFARVLLVGVQGFDEQNTYARYREMEQSRYDLDLRGYMLRAVSQYQREWCRLSHEALAGGFTFATLAARHMDLLHRLPYVIATEMLIVTSASEDVRELRMVLKDTARIIAAMNTMFSELDLDCESCEYQDVCTEASELRRMHTRIVESAARERQRDEGPGC